MVQLSAADAANHAGVPKRTLISWIESGRLRAKKLGNGLNAPYVIDQGDLDTLLAQRDAS